MLLVFVECFLIKVWPEEGPKSTAIDVSTAEFKTTVDVDVGIEKKTTFSTC